MSWNEGPRLRDVATFFTPLALNNMMMMTSHALITAGLARTASPISALAAFALARSVFHLMENPLLSVRQLTVVFARTPQESARTLRFVLTLAGVVSACIVVMGFGPWGTVVMAGLFGVTGEVAEQAVQALRVFAIMPFAVGYRTFNQGLLIRSRQTAAIPIATLIRLGWILLWTVSVPRFPSWGAPAGTAALVSAIVIESILIAWRTRRLPRAEPAQEQVDTGYRAIVMFALPLTLMSLLHCATNPVINFGLGRLSGAVTAMAAFAVGDSLARLGLSPINSLHQAAMVFGQDRVSAKKMQLIAIGLGAILSGLLLIASFTIIDLVIVGMMGLTGDAAHAAAWVFRVFSLQPLVVGVREYHWGILYRRRATAAIGFGKTINVITMVIMMSLGLTLLSGLGAVLGACALLFGEVAEAITIRRLETIDTRARLEAGSF